VRSCTCNATWARRRWRWRSRARGTTGLDFSHVSVLEAQRIAREEALPIEYVCADVYDAVEALGSDRFDIVYTGKGALCYLPDLMAWAQTILRLLKVGGFLYVAEFHPLLNALGPTKKSDFIDDLVIRHDYLGGHGAVERDSASTYTDGPGAGRRHGALRVAAWPWRSCNRPCTNRIHHRLSYRDEFASLAALAGDGANRQRVVDIAGRPTSIPSHIRAQGHSTLALRKPARGPRVTARCHGSAEPNVGGMADNITFGGNE
jgi:SAM-dependent methyltransferase